MKYVFQRGKGSRSAEVDFNGVLFRFGNPPDISSPASTFSCQWDGSVPKLIHSKHDRSENVSLVPPNEDLGVYSFSHPAFDSIQLVKRSWFEDRPQIWGEQGAMMSFQGWSNGQWCDGVYAHWQNARFTDLILPGGAFQVEWGRASQPLNGIEEWCAEQKHFAQKMSLIEAVRAKFTDQFGPETVLDMPSGSFEEVLTVLLLRLAFPQQRFGLIPKNKGQKRLAQNLNITPLRSARKNEAALSANIDWGSSESVHKLLEWQLRQSPFVPLKLWNELIPS